MILVRLILLVFAAVTFVVIGDTAGKLMTASGVSPVFVAWTRFAIALCVILPISGIRLSELADFKDWRVVGRGIAITCGIAAILTALRTEPIANVFGAFFIGPVVSYVLAIVFLGEAPSKTRGALLGLGFLGVMLVVKPGFGGTLGMGFAVLAGCFYGIYLALTRAVAPAFRPRALLVSQLLIGTVLLTPAGVFVEIPAITLGLTGLILVSALGSAIGNYLLVMANRQAEATLVAPLVYTQLISATLVGVMVFGDRPDALTFLGIGLILVSGFGSLWVGRR